MNNPQAKYISLKDIAHELGISISTVSRALMDHPNISSELKTKVKNLAEEWHYQPNPLAMGLLKKNTRTIGVIVPDLVTHFFSSVISGIESLASERGYYMIISSSYESYEKEKNCIKNLLNSRVEGLIVSISCQTKDYSHFEELVRRGIPIVFFDRICLSDRTSIVTVDNREAARGITQHFIDSGRSRIAYISGPEFLNISRERLNGYLEGLKENGLQFNPNYLVICEMNHESATIAVNKLLDLPVIPNAIFGINDTVIFAAMKSIRERGLRIPEDIAVVGFTDNYHSSVMHPTLTSVTHPTFSMGKSAAKLLFERIYGNMEPKQIELKTNLVVRESTIAL